MRPTAESFLPLLISVKRLVPSQKSQIPDKGMSMPHSIDKIWQRCESGRPPPLSRSPQGDSEQAGLNREKIRLDLKFLWRLWQVSQFIRSLVGLPK